MKILLIEPDYILGGIYERALEEAGNSVSLVRGAQAAITAADHTRPDLVLLELQLVEHSGIEFLYEFRSYPEWQDVPVIIQTQVPPSEFVGSWSLLKDELGVEAYLYKPQTKLKSLVKYVKEVPKARV